MSSHKHYKEKIKTRKCYEFIKNIKEMIQNDERE